MLQYKIKIEFLNEELIVKSLHIAMVEEIAVHFIEELCRENDLPVRHHYIRKLVGERDGVSIKLLSNTEIMEMANAPRLPFNWDTI